MYSWNFVWNFFFCFFLVVMVRSKSSLTKEEIEAFWRSRQKAMEEHLKDAAAQKLADHQQAESVSNEHAHFFMG